MSHCDNHSCHSTGTSVCQTLDELDFERGIWYNHRQQADFVWFVKLRVDRALFWPYPVAESVKYAAQYGDLDRVKKLVSQGTCVDLKDKSGYTALHYAARAGHLDVCRYLLTKGADINAVTKCGEATSLHRAASVGKYEIVKLLIENRADVVRKDADGKTVLHRAVESQNDKIIRLLLETCPNLKNEKDCKEKTPLEYVQNDCLKSLFK